MLFAVTTTHHASPERRARARRIAARCGVAFVPRQSTRDATFDAAGTDLLYVVANGRDALRTRAGDDIHVAAGLLKTRLHGGRQHPLLRAVAPDGPLPDVVFDGTLGLAQDALHLAGHGIGVVGTEASPAVYSLLEEGLARLARESAPIGPAAAGITAHLGPARDHLDALGRDAVDVVYLSPMFAKPRKAPPGYAVFRAVAVHAPLDDATIAAARACARHRVVLKLRRDEPPPASWPTQGHLVTGRAVEYRVLPA